MNLNDWMNGPPAWKNKDIAKAVEKDPTYISRIRNGLRPSVDLAKKISAFTNNEVTVNELLKLKEESTTKTKG